uniref:Uncharacterized protein n=1 Tax=Candidatus Methanomethylicus mesodigestus TaxID=1867258 RepID=A0A7C3F3N5_9CREN
MDSDEHLLNLFESLERLYYKQKKIKRLDAPSEFIYDLSKFTKNNLSKVMFESAQCLPRDIAEILIKNKQIRKLPSEDIPKYAITFFGIATCLERKYNVSFYDQYKATINRFDEEISFGEEEKWDWKEKLATITLLMLFSTSEISAIKLDNPRNKENLNQIFSLILTCLQKYAIIDHSKTLPIVKRGESPSSAIMARLNSLPKKTSHIFTFTQESGYYLNLEKNGELDIAKLNMILRKIFEYYDANLDYQKIYEDLYEISRNFKMQFSNRQINPHITLDVSYRVRDFFENELYKYPKQIQG